MRTDAVEASADSMKSSTETQVTVGTVLGSPVAGGTLMARAAKRAGLEREGKLYLALTFAGAA